jgi:hypothetical protein
MVTHPWEEAVRHYAAAGHTPLWGLLELHLRCGYVLNTPTCFALARPVCRAWGDSIISDPRVWDTGGKADCWHITFFAGDMEEGFAHLPFDLPFISFERGDGRLRCEDFKTVKARIISHGKFT